MSRQTPSLSSGIVPLFHYHTFNNEGDSPMTILINGLKFIICAAVAGNFICIQHIFLKYNRILEEAFATYYDAFSFSSISQFLNF